MKKCFTVFLILFCAGLLQQCKSKGGPKNFTETSDTLKFFPVNLYIKGQIARVDSLAGIIYKITISGDSGKRDSSVISKQEFNQLAATFLAVDISDKSIHKYYKENVFADETTQSLTFNYTAMDNTLPLQSVDVLLDNNARYVKNVFFSKLVVAGDSSVTEKNGWKNDNSFYINRMVENAQHVTSTQQNIVTWRFGP